MKKLLLSFMILFLFCPTAFAYKVFGNENIKWDMSVAELESLGIQLEKSDSGLELFFSSTQINEQKVFTAFSFKQDKLVAVSYSFTPENIEDYNIIKNAVTNVYGKPAIDEVTERQKDREPSQRHKEDLFLMVKDGYVALDTIWNDNDTEVSLVFFDDGIFPLIGRVLAMDLDFKKK